MCKLPCENKHNRSKDNKKYEADINAFNSSIRLTPCNSCHFCHRLLFDDETKSYNEKITCSRCFAYCRKNQLPNLSYSNHFDPGTIPPQIACLNFMEKRM